MEQRVKLYFLILIIYFAAFAKMLAQPYYLEPDRKWHVRLPVRVYVYPEKINSRADLGWVFDPNGWRTLSDDGYKELIVQISQRSIDHPNISRNIDTLLSTFLEMKVTKLTFLVDSGIRFAPPVLAFRFKYLKLIGSHTYFEVFDTAQWKVWSISWMDFNYAEESELISALNWFSNQETLHELSLYKGVWPSLFPIKKLARMSIRAFSINGFYLDSTICEIGKTRLLTDTPPWWEAQHPCLEKEEINNQIICIGGDSRSDFFDQAEIWRQKYPRFSYYFENSNNPRRYFEELIRRRLWETLNYKEKARFKND